MIPSLPQLPPRAPPAGASARGDPSPMSTRYICRPSKKPRERLSGDQKGYAGAFRSRDRAGTSRRESLNVETGHPAAVARGERHVSAVRRDRGGAGGVSGRHQLGALGRFDRGADQGGRRRRGTSVPSRHQSPCQRGDHGRRQTPRRTARPSRDGRRGLAIRLASRAQRLEDLEARVGDVVQAVLRVALEAAAEQVAERGRASSAGSGAEVDLGLEHAGERVADTSRRRTATGPSASRRGRRRRPRCRRACRSRRRVPARAPCRRRCRG